MIPVPLRKSILLAKILLKRMLFCYEAKTTPNHYSLLNSSRHDLDRFMLLLIFLEYIKQSRELKPTIPKLKHIKGRKRRTKGN